MWALPQSKPFCLHGPVQCLELLEGKPGTQQCTTASIKLPSVQIEEEKEHRVHNCHEGGNYPNGSKLVFGSDCQLVVVVVIAVFSALAHIYCL